MSPCNKSRCNDRTCSHYPLKDGWHATGAVSDAKYSPITAALTKNRLTCMLLECAFMKVLRLQGFSRV